MLNAKHVARLLLFPAADSKIEKFVTLRVCERTPSRHLCTQSSMCYAQRSMPIRTQLLFQVEKKTQQHRINLIWSFNCISLFPVVKTHTANHSVINFNNHNIISFVFTRSKSPKHVVLMYISFKPFEPHAPTRFSTHDETLQKLKTWSMCGLNYLITVFFFLKCCQPICFEMPLEILPPPVHSGKQINKYSCNNSIFKAQNFISWGGDIFKGKNIFLLAERLGFHF